MAVMVQKRHLQREAKMSVLTRKAAVSRAQGSTKSAFTRGFDALCEAE
jgi:hypothetical protein